MIRKDREKVLEKPERTIEPVEDEFADVQSFTESALSELWLNKSEEVWNRYLKARMTTGRKPAEQGQEPSRR